ncbi:MAG: hypothetical protein K9N09_10970, partial [Candidatus Cloacimonetes bacterium]|nr:hypothetical protein [Candidatus Cloacimonadota bacterium]MCF7814885.1 hypothetical protein [Candidatus Cloacimonadota bacterium]MCF7869208.1 hypothetical protein [Candidatus Cloacimonadota bacterium]MCF7884643.1 hypothetical protein [Candidatus Cloacimonadota bacterium]
RKFLNLTITVAEPRCISLNLFQQAENRIFIIYPSAFGISPQTGEKFWKTPTQSSEEFFRLKTQRNRDNSEHRNLISTSFADKRSISSNGIHVSLSAQRNDVD